MYMYVPCALNLNIARRLRGQLLAHKRKSLELATRLLGGRYHARTDVPRARGGRLRPARFAAAAAAGGVEAGAEPPERRQEDTAAATVTSAAAQLVPCAGDGVAVLRLHGHVLCMVISRQSFSTEMHWPNKYKSTHHHPGRPSPPTQKQTYPGLERRELPREVPHVLHPRVRQGQALRRGQLPAVERVPVDGEEEGVGLFVFVFVWVWMGRGWMCDVRRGNNQTSYVYIRTLMLRCVCPVRRLQPRRRAGSRSKRPRMKACAAVGSLSWPLGLSQCGVCCVYVRRT